MELGSGVNTDPRICNYLLYQPLSQTILCQSAQDDILSQSAARMTF
jgi:hypothetical protein